MNRRLRIRYQPVESNWPGALERRLARVWWPSVASNHSTARAPYALWLVAISCLLGSSSCVSATYCSDKLAKTQADVRRDRVALERAVATNRSDVQARLALVRAHLDEGDRAAARACLDAIPDAECSPGVASLWVACAETGDERRQRASQANAVAPADESAALEIARARRQSGDLKGAMDVLNRLHSLHPPTVESYLEESLVHALAGRRPEAIVAAELALLRDCEERWSAERPIWHWLAGLYEGVGGYEPVVTRFRARCSEPEPQRFAEWRAALSGTSDKMLVVAPIDQRIEHGLVLDDSSTPPAVQVAYCASLGGVAGVMQGDLVLSVAGEVVRTADELEQVTTRLVRGESVTFTVERNGKRLELSTLIRTRWDLAESAGALLERFGGAGPFSVDEALDTLHQAYVRVGLRGSRLRLLLNNLRADVGGSLANAAVRELIQDAAQYPNDAEVQVALVRALIASGARSQAAEQLGALQAGNLGRGDVEALSGLLALADGKLVTARNHFNRAVLLGEGREPLRALARLVDARQAARNNEIAQAAAQGFAIGMGAGAAAGGGRSTQPYSASQAAMDTQTFNMTCQQNVQQFRSALGQ